MRTLRTLALLGLAALAACLPARAQFIGYTFPQNVTQTLATSTACTDSPQLFTVSNLGQTEHFASLVPSGVTALQYSIIGVDSSGNTFTLSDVGTLPLSGGASTLSAVGYYTKIQIDVTCVGGTFTLNYVGTSQTVSPTTGTSLTTTVQKAILFGVSAATSSTAVVFIPPYGNTQGWVSLTAPSGLPSGSSLTVACGAPATATQKWTLPTAAGTDNFFVAAMPCTNLTLQYLSGGASADTYSLAEFFTPPGFPQQFEYALVNATTTVLKTGFGLLHTLTISSIAATGSFAVYDNTACSGTEIAGGTLTAAVGADSMTFDVNFQTGLCVTTTGSVTAAYN